MYNSNLKPNFEKAELKIQKAIKKAKIAAYKDFLTNVCPFIHGLKTEDGVKHTNTKSVVTNFLNGNRSYPIKLTQEKLSQHESGKTTLYYVGSDYKKENGLVTTLAGIDIDCHNSGNLEGAIEVAEYLKQEMFPGMFYETSTNGNGIHGYLKIKLNRFTKKKNTNDINETYKLLQQVLKQICKPFIDANKISDIEIKGQVPTYKVDRNNKVTPYSNIKMGQLMKVPRDIEGASKTLVILHSDLHKLLEKKLETLEIQDSKPNAKKVSVKKIVGSCTNQHIVHNETIRQAVTRLINNAQSNGILIKKGLTVTREDIYVTLLLVNFFTKNMNFDESLPVARVEELWKKLYETKFTNREFNASRFASIRNWLTELGAIKWIDKKYHFYTDSTKKGQACKWKANDCLMALMNKNNSKEEKNKEEASFIRGYLKGFKVVTLIRPELDSNFLTKIDIWRNREEEIKLIMSLAC